MTFTIAGPRQQATVRALRVRFARACMRARMCECNCARPNGAHGAWILVPPPKCTPSHYGCGGCGGCRGLSFDTSLHPAAALCPCPGAGQGACLAEAVASRNCTRSRDTVRGQSLQHRARRLHPWHRAVSSRCTVAVPLDQPRACCLRLTLFLITCFGSQATRQLEQDCSVGDATRSYVPSQLARVP